MAIVGDWVLLGEGIVYESLLVCEYLRLKYGSFGYGVYSYGLAEYY